MNLAPQRSPIIMAVEALQSGQRDHAVKLLKQHLASGPPGGAQWRSFAKLAEQIGEIDLALEASQRFAHTEPAKLENLLQYWGDLATHGRSEIALSEAHQLPAKVQEHPSVQHFFGTIAGSGGDFTAAEDHYRRAISENPNVPQTWFALAMIRKFESADDPDIVAMEALRTKLAGVDHSIRARFLYGLAKAWNDVGDTERAFALYSEGAALRRVDEKFDLAATKRFTDSLIRDFDPAAMAKLTPSQERSSRAIFVNGLPRSGTTLVEQILTSHSKVSDGGEINLVRAALNPVGDFTMSGAMRYQQTKSATKDPWGELARYYHGLLKQRFRGSELVVDKTLTQSHFMGLLLHMLPEARIIWMRRRPEDTALSCFRNFFTSSIPWSWSFADIGGFFRLEDQLYEHWSAMFSDRILTVPYESLAADPGEWIPRILDHAGLEVEPGVFEFYKTKRSVRTASVQQVRSPISTERIGSSKGHEPYMGEFRKAYHD